MILNVSLKNFWISPGVLCGTIIQLFKNHRTHIYVNFFFPDNPISNFNKTLNQWFSMWDWKNFRRVQEFWCLKWARHWSHSCCRTSWTEREKNIDGKNWKGRVDWMTESKIFPSFVLWKGCSIVISHHMVGYGRIFCSKWWEMEVNNGKGSDSMEKLTELSRSDKFVYIFPLLFSIFY